MAENQENIEAKLCAYIENELDPADHAEIVQHLEANPQHRKLLADLAEMRDMLRALPREPAPPEVAETVNGRLERAVLLDDDGAGDSLGRTRISRMPQLMALAAIVVLAVGLGAVVYFALPAGPTKNPVSVARAPQGPSAGPEATGEHEWASGAMPAVPGVSPIQPSVERNFKNGKEPEASPDGGTPNDMKFVKGGGNLPRGGALANASTGARGVPLYVVVTTTDPGSASREVANYLARNGISYDFGDGAAPSASEAERKEKGESPAVGNAMGEGAKVNQSMKTAAQSGNAAAGAGGISEMHKNKSEDKASADRDDVSRDVPDGKSAASDPAGKPPAGAMAGVKQGDSKDSTGELDRQGKNQATESTAPDRAQAHADAATTQGSVAVGSTTQESALATLSPEPSKAKAPGDDKGDSAQAITPGQPSQPQHHGLQQQYGQALNQQQVTAPQKGGSNYQLNAQGNRIIARKMTRRQAIELSSTLQRPAGQRAELVAEDQINGGGNVSVAAPAHQDQIEMPAPARPDELDLLAKKGEGYPHASKRAVEQVRGMPGGGGPDGAQYAAKPGAPTTREGGAGDHLAKADGGATQPSTRPDIVRGNDAFAVQLMTDRNAGEARSFTARIESDGVMKLPDAEPVRTEGLTVPELRDAIAKRYASKTTPPSEAQVTLRRLTEEKDQTASALETERARQGKTGDAMKTARDPSESAGQAASPPGAAAVSPPAQNLPGTEALAQGAAQGESTTQPAGADHAQAAMGTANSASSTQPAGGTTQPTGPGVAPAMRDPLAQQQEVPEDQPVDVVIVLNSEGAMPNATPADAPAAAAPPLTSVQPSTAPNDAPAGAPTTAPADAAVMQKSRR